MNLSSLISLKGHNQTTEQRFCAFSTLSCKKCIDFELSEITSQIRTKKNKNKIYLSFSSEVYSHIAMVPLRCFSLKKVFY